MFRPYAMDTAFYTSLGSYTFDARCEMAAELGYEGAYLTLWSDEAWGDLEAMKNVKQRHGLDPVAVYLTLELTANGISNEAEANRVIDALQGGPRIELSIRRGEDAPEKSDEAGDAAVLPVLERLVTRAERNGLILTLYPHLNFWMERVQDAARLCGKLDHPHLKLVFCGFHWYAADGKALREALTAAAPYLSHANICGCAPPRTILPLDEGELDNFAVLCALRREGQLVEGSWVGVQGYSVAGDVYTKLRRSYRTLQDMQRRMREHPAWGELRWK